MPGSFGKQLRAYCGVASVFVVVVISRVCDMRRQTSLQTVVMHRIVVFCMDINMDTWLCVPANTLSKRNCV